MSVQGRIPKDESIRINRNPARFPNTTIKGDGKTRGMALPPLPLIMGAKQEWSKRTLAWWANYRKSPQAKLMNDTDWESLYVGAFVHNEIFKDRVKPIAASALSLLASELRRREDAVGGTFEARAKLRITVLNEHTKEQEELDISEAAEDFIDYATRLNRKVAEYD